MSTPKYKHLSFEDRCTIQEFLNYGYNFTQIANRLHKDRTTISKEVLKTDSLEIKEQTKIFLVHILLNLLMFVMDALISILVLNFVTLMMLLLLIIITFIPLEMNALIYILLRNKLLLSTILFLL